MLPEHGGDWLRAELERDGITVVAVRGPRELRHQVPAKEPGGARDERDPAAAQGPSGA